MVAGRKEVSRLDIQNQHTRGCPPSALPQREGDGGFLHIDLPLRRSKSDVLYVKRSAKTDWQCRPAGKG